MKAVLLAALVGLVSSLEASLDGETIDIIEEDDLDEEDDLAKEYMQSLNERGVVVHDVKVVNDGEGGLLVVAEKDLDRGHVIAEVSRKSTLIRVKNARKTARDVIKESGKLNGIQEYVLLAVKLMEVEGIHHTLAQERYPTSGLNVSDHTENCLYGEITAHINVLKEAVEEFSNTIVQMGLGTREAAERALIYAFQNGGTLSTFKELGIYPVVDIMEGSVFGQVEPGEMTAESMTLVVNRKVKKGEQLSKAPRITLFRSIALYGQIDDEIEAVPIELSWHAMKPTGQQVLRDYGCGSGTVGMITLKEGYSEMILKCISIAAAFQIDHPEATTTNFADRGTYHPDITLAGYDLLNSIIKTHIEKIPTEPSCYSGKGAIPVLSSMNNRIKTILTKASKKLADHADAYIQVLERHGLIPDGMLEEALGLDDEEL